MRSRECWSRNCAVHLQGFPYSLHDPRLIFDIKISADRAARILGSPVNYQEIRTLHERLCNLDKRLLENRNLLHGPN